jgi:hypothetical protein
MSFAPEEIHCGTCHVTIKRQPFLIYEHPKNGCIHENKVALGGTVLFMKYENSKQQWNWVEPNDRC